VPTAPTIYLLDDESSILRSLTRLLAVEGYESRSFVNVVEFFQAVARQPTPLAVVDYMMPGLNGLQLQECLRTFAPATLVIMISAVSAFTVRDQALKSGAFSFISKPIDDEIFLRAVRESLGIAA
jgi:FixJ family two-component response regulator